ncbi:MAG: VWA domain-containing protein [Alphaproteobacteria bacterium]|nr:VWA domain-containing protein [Alphaproteobacteria bacterium]
MALGDARTGKLADNLVAFGRALRRAGVRTDGSRMALAQQAALCVGLDRKTDVSAALEAVLIGREEDRAVFRELFDAFFRDPEIANKLLAQMLPSTQGETEPNPKRPRVAEALASPRPVGQPPSNDEEKIDFDAAMTASELARLHQADFNALGAAEYQWVQRLARDIALPIPTLPLRRHRAGTRGARLHWQRAMQEAARTDGEVLRLPRWQRIEQPLPVLLLVDVSGSMERYARLLLAFFHTATRRCRRRDVFAFGTDLTDLTDSFQAADPDDMLLRAAARIQDFAGGTRLGESLGTLRRRHARRLVGRRSVVLLISDGLDTGEPEALAQELAWLKRHCRSLLWLNPLLRFDGYAPIARGAAVLHQQADAMLAVHNLSRLEELATSLRQLLRA